MLSGDEREGGFLRWLTDRVFRSVNHARVMELVCTAQINSVKTVPATRTNSTSDSSSRTNPSCSPTSLVYHGNIFLCLTSLPLSVLTPPPTIESLSPVRKRKRPQSVKFVNYLDYGYEPLDDLDVYTGTRLTSILNTMKTID